MTPCARGCCWTPMAGVCARSHACACHPQALDNWLGTPTTEPTNRLGHRDPTANQAIGNVMRARRKEQ